MGRGRPLASCVHTHAVSLLPPSSRTAVAPLERLKILMQVQGNERVYTGVWQVSRRNIKTGTCTHAGETRGESAPASACVRSEAAPSRARGLGSSVYATPVCAGRADEWGNERAATDESKKQGRRRAAVCSLAFALHPTFSSPPPSHFIQGLVRMVRAEGVAGCFKGNWTNCVRIIPNSAVKFLLYEQAVRSLSHASLDGGGDGRLGPVARLGAGAAAGIVAMSATYPLDMVRGRLTVQGGAGAGAAPTTAAAAAAAAGGGAATGARAGAATTAQYSGIAHAARTIVAEEGLVALWRGWLPSVIGVIPYVGLNFCVYETLKDAVLVHTGGKDEREIPVATRLACGALAGTTGQTLAFPLDVVRRRMQMSGWAGAAALHGADPSHASAVAYKGMTDCFVRTVREEGVRALFKGLWPNYIKVVPSIAIAFVSYEQLKEAMGVQLRISS